MSADALVSYAALILADAEVEISSDKLLAITKAAGSPVEQVSISEGNEKFDTEGNDGKRHRTTQKEK